MLPIIFTHIYACVYVVTDPVGPHFYWSIVSGNSQAVRSGLAQSYVPLPLSTESLGCHVSLACSHVSRPLSRCGRAIRALDAPVSQARAPRPRQARSTPFMDTLPWPGPGPTQQYALVTHASPSRCNFEALFTFVGNVKHVPKWCAHSHCSLSWVW